MAATLVVETGLEVPGANSYVTVAQADAYFVNSANTVWAALDAILQKPPYLIMAVRYMQQNYRMRWKGARHTQTQTLDWPRLFVERVDIAAGYGPYPTQVLPTIIPQEIMDAQCELAVRCANGDLAPDIDRLQTSVAVGSLKVTYDENASPNVTFRAVDLLLKPYFEVNGLMSKVGRL